MIINHNITALNTHNKLSAASGAQSKSMEKLASGLRINKAGDDAAGLAISEKMRAQVRGLDQASRNSQDAISLIQTGEGALNETHDILQRMRELAVQSSSDTNTNDDRKKIQSEVDELAKEVTRISNTTEFNTQNLLAGGLKNTYQVGANKGQNISLDIAAMDAKSLGVAGDSVTTSFTGTNTKVSNLTTGSESLNSQYVVATYTAATTAGAASTAAVESAGGAGTVGGTFNGSSDTTFQAKVTAVSGTGAATQVDNIEYTTDGGASWKVASKTGSNFDLGNGVTLAVANDAGNAATNTITFTMNAAKVDLQINSAADGSGTRLGNITTVRNNQSSAVIGNSSTDQTATVSFNFAAMASLTPATPVGDQISQTKQQSSVAVVGADGTVSTAADTKKGLNVSTQSSANLAVETINNAITKVSSERSKLGAYQNRLEHTINNLKTSSENITAAESRVRDVDMAKEMMNQTKNSILAQAAQAMLAQANQQPQGVLQLLR